MVKRKSSLIWLLAAVLVIAVMAGYYVWTAKEEGNNECRDPHAPKPGVVTGIGYAEEGSSAVICYEIVHEGDTIHGVKVVKIHRDKVEFEKNGKKWAQGVREKRNRYWK